MNNKSNRTSKIILLIVVALALTGIIIYGVKKHVNMNVLSTKTFDKIAVDNNYRVKELDVDVENVITWTRGYSDVNEVAMDFIECDSKAAASRLYSEQLEAISIYETDNEKGNNSGNIYTLSASGFYYYLKLDGNFVILVTSKTEHSSEVTSFIAKLPSAK